MASMTSNLDYFRRLNWNSTVCLELSITSDDYNVIDTVYVCPYRNAYPSFIYQQLKQGFLKPNLDANTFKNINDDRVWFQVTDSPSDTPEKLKFHWNIGLSYDYYTFNYSSTSNTLPPLKLSLHLSSPSETTLSSTKLSYMGSLKESQFTYWGSVKRVNQLKTLETEQMWHAVESNDFEDFYKTAKKLLPVPADTDSEDDNQPLLPRSIPLKLILPDQIVVQDIMSPNLTLNQALSASLPLLFPPQDSKYPQLAYPVLNGTVIPLDANILWLASCMSSPDGFLRFCIILY